MSYSARGHWEHAESTFNRTQRVGHPKTLFRNLLAHNTVDCRVVIDLLVLFLFLPPNSICSVPAKNK